MDNFKKRVQTNRSGKAKQKFYKLLSSSEKKIPPKAIFFSLFICAFLYVIHHGITSENISDFTSATKEDIKNLLELSLSVIASIIAALCFSFFYQQEEASAIEYLQDTCESSLLEATIKNFEDLSRRCRYNEQISVVLKKPKDGRNIFICRVSFRYETQLCDTAIFKFYRLNDSAQIPIYSDSSKDLTIPEYYYANDESDFCPGLLKSEDYKLEQVYIDNKKARFTMEEEGMTKIFKVEVPQGIDTSKLQMIQYEVEYPMETESMLFMAHEFPSQQPTIKFDYSLVKDDITPSCIPAVGATASLTADPNNYKNGNIAWKCNGWLLPKQGFIFGWWKKQNG